MSIGLVEVGLYVLLINLATYAAFWSDKRKAIKGEWRTPERHLLMFTALGGWVGALAGQHVLRHKTRKEPFRTVLWCIIVFEAAALAGWLVLFA